MKSEVMNPPVMREAHIVSNHMRNVFPVIVIDALDNKKQDEYNSFKRRLADACRRFDQAWVCGNSRVVAKISYELDDLKREAREKGFEF